MRTPLLIVGAGRRRVPSGGGGDDGGGGGGFVSQPVALPFDDDESAWTSLDALNASPYTTGDLDGNFSVSSVDALASPFVITPVDDASNITGSIRRPLYLATPSAHVWVQVRATLTTSQSAGAGPGNVMLRLNLYPLSTYDGPELRLYTEKAGTAAGSRIGQLNVQVYGDAGSTTTLDVDLPAFDATPVVLTAYAERADTGIVRAVVWLGVDGAPATILFDDVSGGALGDPFDMIHVLMARQRASDETFSGVDASGGWSVRDMDLETGAAYFGLTLP